LEIISDISYGIIPAIKDDNGYKLFIIRHCNGNFWGFPKGHLEEGEGNLEAAKRELFEETRLEVLSLLREDPFKEAYRYQKKDHLVDKRVELYLALTTKEAVIDEKELFEGKWISLNEAENLVTYKEGKALCKEIATYIKENL